MSTLTVEDLVEWEYRVDGPSGLAVTFGIVQFLPGPSSPYRLVIQWTLDGETTTTVPEKVLANRERARMAAERAVRQLVGAQDGGEPKDGYRVRVVWDPRDPTSVKS